MKQLYLTLLSALLTITASQAQPERELRAVWLTSVYNIDWPHSTSATSSAQQARLITILDKLQAANFNAVMFQVRPNADALYQSSYEPWSAWITGNRGQQPSYDPLAFLLQEANKRGMEVHAWLNPYRFENTAGEYAGKPGNYNQTHPDLIINYNGKTYFDPGIPETTDLIKNIVADLITNYNLDGVLFDDYFYPSNLPLSYDQQTYDTYASEEFVGQWYSNLTRGNFRRASVNQMIREVYDTIKSINPGVIFGVSPAGIYSTQSSAASQWGTTLPSGISGNDNYNAINCDPLAWLRDQSVDYISPQLYWLIGGAQDFKTLTQWWGNEAKRYGRHHYPSLGSYRLFDGKNADDPQSSQYKAALDEVLDLKTGEFTEKSNWPLAEIGNQIVANRNSPNNLAQGMIFYNTRSTVDPSKDLSAFLSEDLYAEKTIFPEMDWLPDYQPGAPQIAEIGVVAGSEQDVAAMNIKSSPAQRFLLYGADQLPTKDEKNDPEFLQVLFGKDFSTFYHHNKAFFSVQEFMPNRFTGNQSSFVGYDYLMPAAIIAPNNETVCDGFAFSWQPVNGTESYQVQVALAQSPGNIIYNSPAVTETSFLMPDGLLPGQQEYVYRVKAISGSSVSWSDQGNFFAGQPMATQINSPVNGMQTTNLSVSFQWNSVQDISHYQVQIATDEAFSDESLVIDQHPVSFNLYTAVLDQPNQDYFARVRGVNNCGGGQWSPVINFYVGSLGIAESKPSTVIKVYPNPVHQKCHIIYPEVLENRVIQLHDSRGRVIAHYTRGDATDSEELDLSGVVPGFYFVHVKTSKGKKFVGRLVKSH
jgi:uncharacterized lipoprotein YddW (UPF0748 family)